MTENGERRERIPPEPENTGVDPASPQEVPAATDTSLVRASPAPGGIQEERLSAAILQYRDIGVIKGEASIVFLSQCVHEREQTVAQLRKDKIEAERHAETWRNAFEDANRNLAVTRDRLDSTNDTRRLERILTTMGGIILGAGLKYSIDGAIVGLAAVLVGACMLVAGFFATGSKKDSHK